MIDKPVKILVGDYHDFDDYRHAYQVIGLELTVTEVGQDVSGQYVGVIHTDDPKHLAYVNELAEELSGFSEYD